LQVELAGWVERYLAATDELARAGLMDEGIRLAKERRGAMARLIEIDPRAALELAAPWRWRVALPAAITSEFEEQVDARGDFQVFGAVPLPGAAEFIGPMLRYVTVGERSYRAHVYGRRLLQITKANLPVHGIASDDHLALAEEPVRVLEPEEAQTVLAMAGRAGGEDPPCPACAQPTSLRGKQTWARYGEKLMAFCENSHAVEFGRQLAAAEGGVLTLNATAAGLQPPVNPTWSHGVKTLLFMRVNFPEDPTEPITDEEATDLMDRVNAFFMESSFNKTALITTVSQLVTLPQPKLFYTANGPGALLDHARRAVHAAGLDYQNYDLDIVRHVSVPSFNFGGLASVGGRGVWLQSSGFGVACHELGHNYGLAHANFWNTIRPRLPDNPNNYPFDSDSLTGFDGVIGAGGDVEYGDVFDVMGGGGGPDGHFNAYGKMLLQWLPQSYTREITASGTHRIYASDAWPIERRAYALAIKKDAERTYWVSARSKYANNPWQQNGVELHWNGWSLSIGSSELLDTTPGTPPGRDDAPLVVGRTFSDPGAQVHLTPVARGGSGADTWVDVAVKLGPFPDNHPPSLALTSSSDTVNPGVQVSFRAHASDEDGDSVAYSWDFGDGTFAANESSPAKSWGAAGEYAVRCEVTDMKGGVASQHVVIRVGDPFVHRIKGRVLDSKGKPLQGVRVHNGAVDPQGNYTALYQATFTDSDGRYTLANLPAGAFNVGAFRFGYVVTPFNFERPVTVAGADAEEINFIAHALTQVSVSVAKDADETGTAAGEFAVTRTGEGENPLRVLFKLSGTAKAGADYDQWPNVVKQTNVIAVLNGFLTNVLEFAFVNLPAGVLSTNLPFKPKPDADSEGTETIVLSLALPIQTERFTSTATNTVDIPGWETLVVNTQPTWFQTYPDYVLGAPAEATMNLLDKDPPQLPTVSVTAVHPTTSENSQDAAVLMLSRFGRLENDLLVNLTVSGTATADHDFEALPTAVSIPAGRSLRVLSVAAKADGYLEGNESVVVTISPSTAYKVGTAAATVTIVDNDLPTVTLAAPRNRPRESGVPAGRLVVTRTGDLTGELIVSYLVTGTASSGRDYLRLPGAVTIPAGQAAAALRLEPENDDLLERGETVVVFLSDSPLYNVGSPNSVTLSIVDDELPFVSVAATDDSATEPDDPGEFTITRVGDLRGNLVVNFRLRGTAIPGGDYAPVGSQVTIPGGTPRVILTVLPINDNFREDQETIHLELLPSRDYNLDGALATVHLDDDDSASGPAVGFALQRSSGPESETRVLLSVVASANPPDTTPLSVKYRLSGGTATPGVDFEAPVSGELVFTYVDPASKDPLTNRVQTIPLTILDDTLAETNETIILSLFDPIFIESIETNEVVTGDPPDAVTNIVVITNSQPAFLDSYRFHTYTIIDDDASVVTVKATVADASEQGPRPGKFVFSRTGDTNQPQTVFIQLTGTAANGNDYRPIGNSVTIPAGASSLAVPLQPVDDPQQEFTESVRLTLLGAPGATIGAENRATVTIRDNDGTLEFTGTRFAVSEGDGAATISVQRTSDSTVPVTVDYVVSDGTARAGEDFVATNGTVRFEPGEIVKTFLVPILDDNRVEDEKTIVLTLQNPSSGVPLGGQSIALLILLDDDSEIAFGEPEFIVTENSVFALVELQRRGYVGRNVTVDVNTSDGTALAGTDYAPQNGTLEFAGGQAFRFLTIRPIDDALFEGVEEFFVTLSDPSTGLALGAQSRASVKIADDECYLEFDAPAYSAVEYGGLVTLVVRRFGGTINPVKVDFRTSDGTARSGAEGDYLAQAGTLELRGDELAPAPGGSGESLFVPGETSKTLTVQLNDDDLGERDEFFTVTLLNPRAAGPGALPGSVALGNLAEARVIIEDNETPGEVDFEFNPGFGANERVRAVAVQGDGKLVVGGDFTTLDGVLMNRIARLHADGYLDRSFNPGGGAEGPVHSLAALPNGRLLIGGAFTSYDGAPAEYFARLKGDAALDDTFLTDATPDDFVWAVAAESDGQLLLAGDFRSVGGRQAGRVARLEPSGALDNAFSPGSGADARVHAVAPYPEGKVIVGGSFASFAGGGSRFVARLNADGSLDSSFNTLDAPDGAVRSLAVQPDGMILLAGEFTKIGAVNRAGIARLNPHGTLDLSFDPGRGPDRPVLSVALTPDEKIVIAGEFTSYDQRPRGRFARLLPDGQLDPDFEAGSGADNTVHAVAVQPDTAIVIVGDFTRVNGLPRFRIARVHGDEKFSSGFVQFGAPVFRVAESRAEAVVSVRRTGNNKAPCSVEFTTSDDSALAGADYTARRGMLSFAAGEIERTFTVPILDDALGEGNEALKLTLSNPRDVDLGNRDTASLIIEDDESAVAFGAAEYAVEEDGGGATIAVVRTGNAASAFTVHYSTGDGTATAGADYTAQSSMLEFAAGETTKTFTVPMLNDDQIEPRETVLLALADPTGGVSLGSQATATLTISDDDSRPVFYHLTLLPALAGTVLPPSGRYPAGSVQVLTATPARDFDFVRWDGTLIATNNPLRLTMDRDQTLVARFRVRRVIDTFESGSFSALPWATGGGDAWVVQSDTASDGRFSARSGVIRNGQSSSLALAVTTRGGTGAFDLRVTSESGWDFLEFHLNGVLVQRWSGDIGWQSFQFPIPAGPAQLEWRYVKDANFTAGLDGAYLDNLYLPLDVPDDTDPAAVLSLTPLPTGTMLLGLKGQAGRTYTLEFTPDLREWLPFSTNHLNATLLFLEDPRPLYAPQQFYRAVTK
jgi:uncharacterized delta-60 repeat protein